MTVLDTNVLSEPMKPLPAASVQSWLDSQAPEALYCTSVTLAELLYGVEILPKGRRKEALATLMTGLLTIFRGRVLPFDETAARHYGELAAAARRAGLAFSRADGYIAAVAAAHGAAVATRDTGPFEAAGLVVINPWEA